MREKAFEEKIKKYIEDLGGYWVKFHGNMYTRKGVPDILACINGKFFGIEVKGDGGVTSELQKYEVKKINASGGVGIIVYPKDFESLKGLLNSAV